MRALGWMELADSQVKVCLHEGDHRWWVIKAICPHRWLLTSCTRPHSNLKSVVRVDNPWTSAVDNPRSLESRWWQTKVIGDNTEFKECGSQKNPRNSVVDNPESVESRRWLSRKISERDEGLDSSHLFFLQNNLYAFWKGIQSALSITSYNVQR